MTQRRETRDRASQRTSDRAGERAFDALLRVQYRLTDRDMVLLGWLADHGLLTTPQIANALFPSTDFAQRRLAKLHAAGVVDRFRPQRAEGGTYPYHWVLAQLGVDVVAAQRGDEELPRRDSARKRRWWLTNRANLPHLLAVNQFFTDLAGHARTHPGTAMTRWWPSARCQRVGAFSALGSPFLHSEHWSAVIAPDGHGVWASASTPHLGPESATSGVPRDSGTAAAQVPFFAEIDLGTEDLPRLAGKMLAYQRWSRTTGQVWPVLIWLTSTIRERHLHERLRDHPTLVPVATATTDLTAQLDLDPAGPVWWLHDPGRTVSGARVTLTDLAATVTTTPRTVSR